MLDYGGISADILEIMAELTSIEKIKLEKFFQMSSGYVLDFSNRTFQQYVFEICNRDIYSEKYGYGSGSKANRLRGFWKEEAGPVVSKLICAMLEYWKTKKLTRGEEINLQEDALYDECHKIAVRLKNDTSVEDIDALEPNANDKTFKLLAESIKESIEKNSPEQALDRLHTFVVRYTRELCDHHGIPYTSDTPLHSLFGSYVKSLRGKKLIESEMAERILKSSISVLEAFNEVRNNRSLAHGNPILNYHESMLIFNNIVNVVRFIESIEPQASTDNIAGAGLEEIPF